MGNSSKKDSKLDFKVQKGVNAFNEPSIQLTLFSADKLPRQTPSKLNANLPAYEMVEKSMPLYVMDIREFEGRIKKMVMGKKTVSFL